MESGVSVINLSSVIESLGYTSLFLFSPVYAGTVLLE